MSEANKARSRRVFEEITSQGNLDAIEEVIAENFVNQPFGATGPAGVRQLVTMLLTAFPDLTETVEEQIAEGDVVVSRVTLRGTHEGPLQPANIPPTGKPVAFAGIIIHRHADGRIVEGYSLIDQLSLLRQIGAIRS
ncbi:MAG: ester cyclase [Chloroflexi bacterium]|nr:ester cyclase [Chloroflexota bacterium]